MHNQGNRIIRFPMLYKPSQGPRYFRRGLHPQMLLDRNPERRWYRLRVGGIVDARDGLRRGRFFMSALTWPRHAQNVDAARGRVLN